MPRLTQIIGSEKKEYVLGEGSTRIGRHPENEIVLKDSLISRMHAEIRSDNGGFRIVDLDSLNGIYVNSEKVKDKPLADHDVITIGNIKLRYTAASDADGGSSDETILKQEPHAPDGVPAGKQEASSPGRAIGLSGEELVKPLPETDEDFEVGVLDSLDEDRKRMRELGAAEGDEPLRRRTLFMIYKVARSLNSTNSLSELLERTIKVILEFMNADRAVVFLKNDAGGLTAEASTARPGVDPPDLEVVRTMTERSIGQGAAIACADACYLTDEDTDPPPGAENIRSAMCVPIWERDVISGAIYLDNLSDARAFSEQDMDRVAAVANLVALRIEQDKMQERIKQSALFRANLERFHSPDVTNLIMRQSREEQGIREFLKEREVTILFADIAGFTSLIERIDAEEAADLLNNYFDEMTNVIFKYGGTVDKFIGDAIMAIFGAPISHGNDAELAVFSAIEMMQRMEWFKALRKDRQKFDIRIGINTGIVITGYMGSKKRIEYSVLGDPVNVAARLQELAKPRTILIGEDTYAKVRGIFKVEDKGTSTLKGKKKKTRVYEIMVE